VVNSSTSRWLRTGADRMPTRCYRTRCCPALAANDCRRCAVISRMTGSAIEN
jgi:hypothetical protein